MKYTNNEFRCRTETNIDILTHYKSDQVVTVTHTYYEMIDPTKKGNIITVRKNPGGSNFISIDTQLIDRIEDIDKTTVRFYLNTIIFQYIDIKVGLTQRKELCKFFYNIRENDKCKLNIRYNPIKRGI